MSEDKVSIIRTPHSKERPYFSMARFSAQDENLSWEARGVLAYLLSKPDNWQVQIKDLQQKCGRDKVRSILKELIDAKYLTVKQEHDTETGRFLRNVYKVYEVPFTENPSTDNPTTENPTHTYNRSEQSTDIQPPNPRKRGEKKPRQPKQDNPEVTALITAWANAAGLSTMGESMSTSFRKTRAKEMLALGITASEIEVYTKECVADGGAIPEFAFLTDKITLWRARGTHQALQNTRAERDKRLLAANGIKEIING